MRRYELSDQQWARISSLFRQRTRIGKVGRPPNDHCRIVNGILWILHTGAPWRDLPERYGPWQTVFTRFNGWRRDGTWARIATSLLDELDDKGEIDHDLWCIDGSVILASRAAAGGEKRGSGSRQLGGRKQAQLQEPLDHALDRSRGGFTTKVHLVCDKHGSILTLHVTTGQAHESKALEPTMARRLLHLRGWPSRLARDKGYDYRRIRRWCRRRQIKPVIPSRKNQPWEEDFDKATYRQRNIIERVVGWYKEYRALGTRHEKLAVNYVVLWLVALIDGSLKKLFYKRI
jgi:transposase